MTPAVKALQKAGIVHQILAYDHDPAADSYGLEAATLLGLDPASVYKTLVAVVADDQPVVAVVPVSTTLDLRALARAAGGKKAVMADPALAERVTGYVVGGISPIGQKRRLPTFVDDAAADLATIHVSAGRRGLEVALTPADLLAATGGQHRSIAKPADR
ncbi:MAG: Cys-tRNA(Pro) deacylase [Acidimicrobiales bacterium]